MTKNDFKYGIIMFLSFLAWFLLGLLLGFYTNLSFRIFNIVIHALVIYMAIRAFYRSHPDRDFNYLSGIMAGFRPSIVGVLLFVIFMWIYLSMDVAFMDYIQENAPYGEDLNPIAASMILFFEGLGATVVLSYIAMRIVDHQEIADEDYETRL